MQFRPGLRWLILLTLWAALPGGLHALIEIDLGAPLVACGTGDADFDCLNDALEDQLGTSLAPILFFDEDEGCMGGTAWTSSSDDLHFTPRIFFQVRPKGTGVREWQPGEVNRTVTLSYYFFYPLDCQRCAGFGGHLGDIEKVRFRLTSRDLRTWSISSGTYFHHGDNDTISGSRIEEIAEAIDSQVPVVAASQSSHGSFEGSIGSGSCGTGISGFLGICTDDCWCREDSLEECFDDGARDGLWVRLSAFSMSNLGEPTAFRTDGPINRITETVNGQSTTQFVTTDNTGHGSNREYWSRNPPEDFDGFCGWKCRDWRRDGESCRSRAHHKSKCIGNIWPKLDHGSFTLNPPAPPIGCLPESCPPGEFCFRGRCVPL